MATSQMKDSHSRIRLRVMFSTKAKSTNGIAELLSAKNQDEFPPGDYLRCLKKYFPINELLISPMKLTCAFEKFAAVM